MTESEFYHKDHISLLSNHLLENNWVWLYKKGSHLDLSPSIFYRYWCYLADPNSAVRSLKNYERDIEENSPSLLMADYSYRSHAKTGFEHLTTIRSFKINCGWIEQIRVCDELIYFHNLFERIEDEVIRYYKTDDNNTLVCEIGKNYAKILNRYLIEFMAAKKMDLVCIAQSEIEYDMNTFTPPFSYTATTEQGISLSKTHNQNYNLMINPCFSNMRNWFNGKMVYGHRSLKQLIETKQSPIPFIIDEDADGQPIVADYESNPYSKVYFNKSLLNSYKSGVSNLNIKPLSISTSDFYIRCDNDLDSCIIAFLKDVWDLPLSEQKKWYGYNISPNGTDFSDFFKQSIIHGNWLGEIHSKDFIFRDTYQTLLNKWNSQFGWIPFKPLNSYQKELVESLIILPDNSPKDLSELLQLICLLFHESLNFNEFPITQNDEETKINFLHRMLESYGITDTSLRDFLFHIQRLRSKITTAHHLSNKIDSKTKKSYVFFGLKPDLSNTAETSINIFEKGIDAMKRIISIF